MSALEDAPNPQCSNPDCKIASGGRCLEGFAERSECPQFGKVLLIIPDSTPVVAPPARTGIRLPHSGALAIGEATDLLSRGPCNVISLVGPFDSGKTSLIAGIYDLLQRGPVGGYAFAGSSTMHSFERACHDSRRESERSEAHMERTERGEVLFFHIDLVNEERDAKRAALFGNRAGEEYTLVQDEIDLAQGYPELKRSDVLTILIDGAKLLDAGERHQVRSQARMTLRAFIEVGVVPPWQRLALVLTKLDAIRGDAVARDGALRYFATLVADVKLEYGTKFAEIQEFEVAASPKSTNAHRGDGMNELLQYWLADPCRNAPIAIPKKTVSAERAFGRLRPSATRISS